MNTIAMLQAQNEIMEAAESKLGRLREKLEGEIKEWENEVSILKTKLGGVRNQLAEKEDKIAEMAAQIRHLQMEHAQLNKVKFFSSS